MSDDETDVIRSSPGKRGGRPCGRNTRIAVVDVLDWLAAGLSVDDIISDVPELTQGDIQTCLAFAADRERERAHAAE